MRVLVREPIAEAGLELLRAHFDVDVDETSPLDEIVDRYEAIVKLQAGGTTIPAFDMATLPITSSPDEDTFARIRANTRQPYARPRREVEAEIGRETTSSPSPWNRHDVYEE